MNKIISKEVFVTGALLLVAVAWFAVVTVMPSRAEAATTAELQAQIDSLTSQINTLQTQARQQNNFGGSVTSQEISNIFSGFRTMFPATIGSSTPGQVWRDAVAARRAVWCDMRWTRPLRVGDRGQDVLALQRFLNANPATQVANSGSGAPGAETDYFGPMTAAALARFQESNASEVLAPAGLTRGSGYFGVLSQRWIERICGSVAVTKFDIDDVESVTSRYVDPSPMMADEEYTIYTIKLENGKTFTVQTGFMPLEAIEARFRAIGYEGDVEDLMDMAEPEEDEEEVMQIERERRTVTITFDLTNGCKGYELDWGDGKTDELEGSDADMCTQAIRTIELTHTYRQYKTYEIELTITGGGESETYTETIRTRRD